MTGATNPPAQPNGFGVLPEQEGMILQQGGEELRLEKVGDRFTLRLAPATASETLVPQLNARSTKSIDAVDLVEVQVDPGQLEQTMNRARSLEPVEFASHVYRLATSPQTFFYLTDELTVQFAPNVALDTVRAIATDLGLRSLKPLAGVPQTYIFQVTKQAVANPIKLANQLMRRPDVLTAEPNIVIRTQSHYRPKDPVYPQQWYLKSSGTGQQAPGADISAEAAWDITRGDRSIVVAITDDGFDLNHPDFQGVGKIVAPRDFKDNNALPLPEASSDNHGTACAGVAIAEENGVGIVGVAPGCSFMPIRTSGFLDDQAIENLFDWAVSQRASVISCSWGASAVYFPLSLRKRAALTRAATQGRNGKGCVIVFAAGNANRPTSGSINEQGWPNNLVSGVTQWLNGFAIHPDVITVAACTSLNRKAAYSNWGDAISVCAPSNNAPPGMWLAPAGYVFTPPQVTGNLPGIGVTTADRTGNPGYEAGDYTNTFGGTSSACPVVAGVAALVLSANPDLTAQEVRQILQATADKITDSTVDPQFGWNRGNYDANGHSDWFGYGKVNALRAVQSARSRLVAPPPVSRWLQLQNAIAVAIPDFNLQGAVSLIQVNEGATLRDIQITVDVAHSFLGDLEISLTAPTGETLLLQSRILGRQTRLQTMYSLQTTPTLRRLLNRPVRGPWQMRLVDFAPLNTGTLNRWQLNLGL